MARLSKIPDRLHDEIKKKSAEGLSAGKIKEWLEKEHNIKAGLTGISAFLKSVKEERKEVAKQVFAAKAAETALQDIDILGNKVLMFDQKVNEAIKDGNSGDAKIYGDLLFKFLDRKMKLSGIDDNHSEDDKILDSLMDKLGK